MYLVQIFMMKFLIFTRLNFFISLFIAYDIFDNKIIR